jgi:hypothetical protein
MHSEDPESLQFGKQPKSAAMKSSYARATKPWDWSRQQFRRPELDSDSLLEAACQERNSAARLFMDIDFDAECSSGGRNDPPRLSNQLCIREAYRLTGSYFPGPVARDMILRIQEHKWLTAEKEGRDIWKECDPTRGWQTAANDWLDHHFESWKEYWKAHQAEFSC